MLRKLELDEIENAAELAYSLSQSLTSNSYPLRDSQNEFHERYKLNTKYKDDELLGYFIKNELIAVVYLTVLKSDLYLQTNGLFIKSNFKTVITEFINYLQVNYGGYKVYIGLPKENEMTINHLLNNGFTLTESSTDMRLKRDDFIARELHNKIVKINKNNYPDFAQFHDSEAGEIYWNSKRIKEDINNWIIYSIWLDSKVRGTIATKKSTNNKEELEVFALLMDKDTRIKEGEADLITAALTDCFYNHNIKNVVYFINANDKRAEVYSKKLGFKVYSNYRCLSTRL